MNRRPSEETLPGVAPPGTASDAEPCSANSCRRITSADLRDPAHARAVVELLDAYARDPMGGGGALSEYARKHLIERLRERPGVHVFLAFLDEQPAGLAICLEGFSTFACQPLLNIHDFAVVNEFRGQGFARALLAAVEAHAQALGCCKITLEVLEGNAPARALYQAVGFAGYELNPALGKAVFLQKKLAPDDAGEPTIDQVST